MSGELEQYSLVAGLFGGLALFLFGLDILTRALKQVAGDYMKSMLAKMTNNRFVGVATGAAVTAVIQSSSITTVLLVGFISAGLMSMSQSVSVILGANIGTTITAQILAFKVTKFALPILAIGFFLSLIAKREEWRQYGMILLGLGMVFLGMGTMSSAMKPLRDYQPFLDFMISIDHALLAALVGAAFTAIIQSSSATTAILIVMAGQGLVGLETAIAIALGANVGTCVTAILASIGKPREAVRAALAHTIFNVAGVLIWIGFVDQLASLARLISPSYQDLDGLARSAAEMPRQIANVHTFFNVINAAIFIGFTGQLTRLVEWLVPDRPLRADERFAARFIDEQLLGTPTIALDAARRELVRLGALVRDMFAEVIPTATSGSRIQLDELEVMDRPVDALHRDIVNYLRNISLSNLTAEQSELLVALIKVANDFEHIGDQIATNLVTSARKRLDENVSMSEPTAIAIANLHGRALDAVDQVILSLDQENRQAAKQARALKQDFAEMIEDIAKHEVMRLQADEPKRLMTYAREVELIEILSDIFKTTRRIARTLVQIFPTSKPDKSSD